jgi:hypothetical protein
MSTARRAAAKIVLKGFREGDRVRRKRDGMEGEVTYVGSGPRGDALSVLWDNPVQRLLGPDIVLPGSVELVRG